MSKDTLTVTDNRTGRTYELPITHGTVKAMDLRAIKVEEDDFGLMSYDPAFKNTASTKSTITYIDGDNGILRYCGYPIEQLAEKSDFLEVAYLLMHRELPDAQQLAQWKHEITYHTLVHENLREVIDGFRYDAHPMSILISSVAALGTFYPEGDQVQDPDNRLLQSQRLIAKMPTLAAMAYRHMMGQPIAYPNNELTYTGNFLSMMFRKVDPYEPDPVLSRALDILFILHADHEQNCGTNTMRSAGSSLVDPYSAVAAASAALFGPRHGGANEAVLRMLAEIGDAKRVAEYVDRVKRREFRLMGFGHRVYRNYDPRAAIIKDVAHQVFEITGASPLLDVALELERVALEDEFFIERSLYPNVDFYSGIIYQALDIPTSMFTVMFAIARTVGWLSQWDELLRDDEQAIARPRQIYLGSGKRDYVTKR
jgi:citrate synthase